ncbi:MAG TPA: DUF3830 family protein [Solirubrobacteraceae bacterium]|jgi:hypothetical protein|nr:DUF3830 family protein [Solirubrobacteraceae bacterium]
MARRIEAGLQRRGVTCIAELLDDVAPRTCQAVWDALPLRSQVYHGKYARNEIYSLTPSFAAREPGLENPTITPARGDVMYFCFQAGQLHTRSHGYLDEGGSEDPQELIIDLALFYERNNLLLNPDTGFVPGSVFATITEGLEEMAAAAQDLWFRGVEGEQLSFTRL